MSRERDDVFARRGLRRVINVSGTETHFGASPVRADVLRAVTELAPHSVLMSELQLAAGRCIASVSGSQAGCVTGCTAASISIAVAACMTGCDLGRVEQLPDTDGMRNEVVMLRGHLVAYAHPVEQNVRIAGARVVPVGAATDAGLYQLVHALTPRTAAALYVVSPLAVGPRLPDLASFVATCRARDVPVIVDAAAMPDPRPYVAAGADLVLWSAHKAFGGLTAGIVAGASERVRACLYQEHGIGRPMKVGKEGVIGAIAALEAWAARDPVAEAAVLQARASRTAERLSRIAGVAATPAGRQVRVRIDAARAGTTAGAVAACLEAGDPAIFVWAHHAIDGELMLGMAKIDDATAEHVCERFEQALAGDAARFAGSTSTYADQMHARLLDWTRRV